MSPFWLWWCEMGIATIILSFIKVYLKPSNPDWSKMADPFSKKSQQMVVLSFAFTLLLWPMVLVAMAFEENR